MRGTTLLMTILTAVWAVVWLVTQAIPSTPLHTTPTMLIGVTLTLIVVRGYPSALRGPRRRTGLSAATLDTAPGDPLTLVNRSLPHLREGLTEETATRSARELLALTGGWEVEITDNERVLGQAASADRTLVGPPVPADQEPGRQPHGVTAGNGSRPPGGSSAGTGHSGPTTEAPVTLSDASRAAIKLNQPVRRRRANRLVVATPLRLDNRIIGTIAVSFEPHERPPIERIEAVANLVSLHVEIAELTDRAQLAADAKLDALRAQINPHFLFNTLNTIAAKSRTDPDEARNLLQRLADFFRYATQQEGHFAEFAHEYFFVRTYLSLEQARFDERLNVHYDIDPQVLVAQVPVLIIQPLVENAVKHGIAPKPGGGTVTLRARVDPLAGSIRIAVRDDGVGMDAQTLAEVVNGTYECSSRNGVGLRNIHDRLERLFGSRYRLDIRSSVTKGTRINLEIPL